MKRGRWRDLMVLLLLLAVAGTILSCPKKRKPPIVEDGVTGITPPPPFKWVFLEYVPPESESDRCRIVVTPKEATIWTPPRDPHKVMWRVIGKDPDHKWLISKKETQKADHFPIPPVKTIPCGPSNSFNSGPSVNTKPGLNTWNYGIEVYECGKYGRKDELLCEYDPKIHIRR